jgi:hypothetical protein
MASNGDRTGTFLGIPYNWNRPTVEREKKTRRDPENVKFVVPRAYGWGYAFNFGASRCGSSESSRS